MEPKVKWYQKKEVPGKADCNISNFGYLQPEAEQAAPDENKGMQLHLGVQLEQSGNQIQINLKIFGSWVYLEQQAEPELPEK